MSNKQVELIQGLKAVSRPVREHLNGELASSLERFSSINDGNDFYRLQGRVSTLKELIGAIERADRME